MSDEQRITILLTNLQNVSKDLYDTASQLGRITKEQAIQVQEVQLLLSVVLGSFATEA